MFTHTHTHTHTPTGLVGRVLVNGPGDWGSIPDQVIPKMQKMVLDNSLFNSAL